MIYFMKQLRILLALQSVWVREQEIYLTGWTDLIILCGKHHADATWLNYTQSESLLSSTRPKRGFNYS